MVGNFLNGQIVRGETFVGCLSVYACVDKQEQAGEDVFWHELAVTRSECKLRGKIREIVILGA